MCMSAFWKIYRLALIALMVSLLFSSCSVEKKLAKEFRENWHDTVAMVLMPDYIFKNNIKAFEYPGIDTLPQPEQDSLLFFGSTFLKEISDSTVMNGFEKKFIRQLEKYPIRVMKEQSLDSFMTSPASGILINIAQMSVEEFIHPYSFDYDLTDEYLSVDSIDLNAVSLNVWIEVSMLNSMEKNKVLFASDFILDELEGFFRQYIFSGSIEFEYSIDTLSMQRIYLFTEEMGARCASYLYDYFLNRYIQSKVPENYPFEVRSLHWDPDRKYFEFREPDGGLIELQPGNR